MKDVNVTSIVPVDLNSLLCVNARTLSSFYSRLGNNQKRKYYADLADQKNKTMSSIFWDQTDGIWYDYDLNAKSRRRLVSWTLLKVKVKEIGNIFIQESPSPVSWWILQTGNIKTAQ